MKKSAWAQFTKQFPNADKTQFDVETSVDKKYNISAEIFFNEGAGSSLRRVFVTKFRYIFQKTRLKHTASAEAKTWLRGPNMKHWPQQPNFTVFCATQGCGISWEIFDSRFSLTQQIRAFHQFHVYFTVRRVLYQLQQPL